MGLQQRVKEVMKPEGGRSGIPRVLSRSTRRFRANVESCHLKRWGMRIHVSGVRAENILIDVS
jgi:hypothetical protein